MLKYFFIGNIYTLEDMPYIIYDFYLVKNSSKYSLIIDFFDSKDIEIEILRHRITEKVFAKNVEFRRNSSSSKTFEWIEKLNLN